jgi:type II secretory pathway pseudopilin PulG
MLQRGVVLLWLLLLVAMAAAGASVVVTRWSDENRRNQERELLEAGDAIAGALASYARTSAASQRRTPPSLDDLLEDRRAFGVLRHLRRIPPDPTDVHRPWGLLLGADGGVRGVYSQSRAEPLLKQPITLAHVDLGPAARQSDWHFIPREERP